LGAIETSVYEDSNGNSNFDIASLPDAGRTVYLDTNDNGFLDPGEPTEVTNSAGIALFTGLSPGAYVVRQLLPGGETQTAPLNNAAASVNLSSGQTVSVGPFNSGPAATGSISGSIFLDANGHGVQDPGEQNASSGTIFIGSNQDGVYDVSDISATETSSGFRFNNLTPGTYKLRQILNPGYQQTAPAAGASLTVTVTAGQNSTISFGTDDPTPTAVISGPTTVPEGSSISLSAADSSEIGGQISLYEWDLNYNGFTFNSSAAGATVPFSAAALTGPSTDTVALRVTDAAGNTNTATTAVNITGVPPTATFTGSTITVGSPATVTFTNPFNPSSAEVAAGFTYSYSFADNGVFNVIGSSPTATVPASDLTTVGAHLIEGEISDAGGGQSIYTATVQVNAVVPVKLTGTVIGTSGSYNNDGDTIANAFDGSFSTYFDAPTASGSWVGLDLGLPKIITQVGYASRSGFASRINGGTFQASSSSNFSTGVVTLVVIGASANPSSTALTNSPVTVDTPYRYVRYIGPTNSYCNASELEFFGISPAPVAVTAVNFDASGSLQALSFTFSGSLSADPGVAAIDLENVTTTASAKVATSNLSEAYNASTYVMTVTFPGFSSGDLPAGIYQATLIAADVTDSNGLHPSANAVYTFRTVPGGSKLTLATGRVTVTVQQISIPTGALLDLSNNNLIYSGGGPGAFSMVSQLIQSGYQDGTWQGSSGIISGAAASDGKHLTALGLTLSTGQVFEQMPTQVGDVLVKFTYYGDTNLDGKVDGSDYTRIDNGSLNHLTGWFNGDFNYDGIINGSDYTLIDNSYDMQGASLAAQIAPAAVVPKRGRAATTPDSVFSQLQVSSPSLGAADNWINQPGSVAAAIFATNDDRLPRIKVMGETDD